MNHSSPQIRQERADTPPRLLVAVRYAKAILGALERFVVAAKAGRAKNHGAADMFGPHRDGIGQAQKQGVRTGYTNANPDPSVHYRKVNTRPCTPAPVQVFTLYTLPYGESGYRGVHSARLYTQGVHLYTLVGEHPTKAGSTY
jgi:hypothetical protein